jgi:hypothetical protein
VDARGFLDRMVGDWDLTGAMGDVPLHQAVEARWSLGNTFVTMHCRSVVPVREGEIPYEAIYHIGYSEQHDLYVMHLLDTFGVSLRPVPGIGRREGNALPFVFQYEEGPFTNTFTWDGGTGTWTHHLVAATGEHFATKHLTRK